MCWPLVGADDPLLGCTRQRNLLHHEYGAVVLTTATAYASRLPQPLSRHLKLACLSIAMKYTEDEPLAHAHLFPGTTPSDLQQAEWAVLEVLQYSLRD